MNKELLDFLDKQTKQFINSNDKECKARLLAIMEVCKSTLNKPTKNANK